ncbi:MAG: SusC/RagA family TonB-linked outer membrane protein [Cytophagales bacterium]|nr:SusC/RagA family TonB-linked outer membrane protein [Cytophagales bacterium]
MKKTLLFSLLLSAMMIAQAAAQTKTLSGKVTDESGSALPGVSVVVKGTTTGTVTDTQGAFKLQVPESSTALIFSFIGHVPKEVTIGQQTSFTVALASDVQALTEVVVTALGFETQKDKQGSVSSKVTGKDIVRTGEPGVINSLAGRAAGVQISRSSGDPGAGTYIQIRGQSTITGSNQPLVIIDGIPMSNSNIGETAGGVRQQSRMNDINPEDIADLQILKGASAAALWGSRAANGVIIITTKKGRNTNKIDVSFRSTLSLDRVNVLHPLQDKFGQGSRGVFSPTASGSWGDRIADRSGAADEVNTTGQFFEAEDGTRYYPITRKNSRETFNEDRIDQVFRTGYSLDNALSLSGGDEKTSYFLSIADLSQKGIIRGQSDYRRSSIRFNTDRRFGEWLKISTSANYIRSTSNRIQTGSNINGLYLGMVRTPPDYDNRDYRGFYYASPTAAPVFRQRAYRRYLGNDNPIYDDPLWVINDHRNPSKTDRFIMSSEFLLKPVSWFELITRGGLDTYTENRKYYLPVGSAGAAFAGSFEEQSITELQYNLDVIGRITKDISPNITGNYVIGWNINNRDYLDLGGTYNNFLIAEAPYSYNNATASNRVPRRFETRIRTTRLFTTLNFGFYNQLFLNVGAAAESGSPFQRNATFYYPSADLAWQFSQLPFLSTSRVLSFGKLRLAAGIVGVQPEPYRTSTDFTSASFAGGWGGTLTGTVYGNGGFVQSSQQGDPNLRPERKSEWEVGTDLRFLNDRISTGFTYYRNEIRDLLLEVAAAPTTGFTTRYTNAGTMTNRGWETELSARVLQKEGFSVDLIANASRNVNRVTDLAGTDQIVLGGFSTLTSSVAKVGYSLSALYGGPYARRPDGSLDLNENGFPKVNPNFAVIGDPNPDWRAGFGTNVSFKKFTLNVLFETFQGADFAPNTQSVLYNFGTHADVGNEVTIPAGGLVNYVGQRVAAGTVVRGNIRDFGAGPVLLDENWYTTLGQGFSALQEQFIQDGSWTRLREATLSYSLNSEGFRKRSRLQSIDFAVTGRNLLLWTKIVGIDPETSLNGAANGRGQDYFNNPGSKSLVFSVRINY